MRTFIEQSEDSRILNAKCKNLVTAVFSAIRPNEQFVKIPANIDIARDAAGKGKLLVLKEGYLTYSLNGSKIFFYEQGDLVGLDYLYGGARAQISSSFSTSVDVYEIDSVLTALHAKPDLFRAWNELLVHHLNFAMSSLATVTREQVHFKPEERVIAAGETIVEQGSLGYEVFALVSGHAEVLVDGVKVGEVLEDELFGVFAAISHSPRNATVRATRESKLLSLHIDNFVELVRYRPSTVLKLVQGLARSMADLNSQVARGSVAERSTELRAH